MRAVDVIVRKRDGHALTPAELKFVVDGVIGGTIPDYQVSALLMAMFLRGLTPAETVALTEAMAGSGRRIDLSFLPGIKVGKHSTGGVGDKTSIIVVPTVAACGVPVMKSSGRALGHTGGTLDKLESIPGFQTSLDAEALRALLRDLRCAFVGQTADIAPADKKLYALRDVTGTIESVPLIASSIMSKKICEGSDALVLDVKVGAGAFMKAVEPARSLARTMVDIGRRVGLRTEALLTDMEAPLGRAVGNALEIRECIQALQGNAPADLRAICTALAARMLRLGGVESSLEAAEARVRRAIESGDALERFRAVVERQGGDPHVVDAPERLPQAKTVRVVEASESGFLRELRADLVGLASVVLGAGRDRADDEIDPAAGVFLHAKPGDCVHRGDPIAELHVGERGDLDQAKRLMAQAAVIGDAPPAAREPVLGVEA
ncbi:MAG TPA: thymidine phosphorylase [Vicinamibacterales bacterium]|nr:thymidine phosphorylase [Vicinamibacterales bacterium]